MAPVSERKTTIADDVQDTFSESSFHKDLAGYLREAAADDEISPEDMIAVRMTTSFLLNIDSSIVIEERKIEMDVPKLKVKLTISKFLDPMNPDWLCGDRKR